jgi:uncharacterized protein (DUF58 family)
MFDFESVEKEDLTSGPSRANPEGRNSLLDHRWVWMAIILFVVGMLFRNGALITMTGLMLGIVIVSWNWNKRVLANIRYRRQFHHRRAFPGEEVEAHLLVENHKWLPVTWLQVEDEWPSAFGPTDQSVLSASSGPSMGYLVNVYWLRWHERVRRRYLLRARQRGVYPAGPAHMVSGDPFGLFEDDAQSARRDLLIVYPEVKPLEELGLDAKDPFGNVRTPQRLFEDTSRIMGVRDYRPDDSFRHIHWKATARTGDLQVRQYEPTRTQSVVLCLNIASFDRSVHGIWPAMVEYVISVAASLASWAVEAQYAVGLVANATLAQTDRPLRTQPSRNRDQLAHLLEAMAGISYFVTSDYARFVLEESRRIPWGATLVAITGLVNESILASLVRLRQSGRRVVLVVLGKTPPPYLSDIRTYHLPIAEASPESQPAAPDDGEGETPRQRYLRRRAQEEDRKAGTVSRAAH